MATTFNILIVGSDPKLTPEIAAALETLDDVRAVTHPVAEFRQAVEAARSRAPDLVIVEMTLDIRMLQAFAQEIEAVSPRTTLAAAFRADVFGPDASESTVLIEALRAGVKDFLRRPVSTADLRSLIGRLNRPTPIEPLIAGSIISFISNKGGVGKSTLAVNVACGLAVRHPDRVALIDASLQMGVCASMLDLQPRTTISDAV